MKKHKRLSALFLKYFVYYGLGIVSILVILGFFLNSFVIGQFLRFSEEEYENILATKISRLNVDMDALKTTAIRAQSLPSGTPFLITQNPSDKLNTINELVLLTAINPSIENIALCYSVSPDNLIATPGTMTLDTFAKNYIAGEWDGERLKAAITQAEGLQLILTDSTDNNKKNPQQFLAVAGIPYDQKEGYGHVIFVLDNNLLTRTLADNMGSYDNFIMISNEQGQRYIVNSNPQAPIMSLASTIDDAMQRDNLIISQKMKYGYTYTIGIPKQQLYQKIENLWRMCITVLSLVSVVGMLIAFFIAENLYRPIRRLSESMGWQGSSESELKFISNSIANLSTIKSQTENMLGEVKAQLFQNLLWHEIHDIDSVNELFDFVRVRFNYDWFCVIKITNNDFANLSPEQQQSLWMPPDDTDKIYAVYQTVFSDSVCLIVNCESNDSNAVQSWVTQSLSSKSTLFVSIGDMVNDILRLNHSYETASFVLACHSPEKTGVVITSEEAMQEISLNYSYPKVDEARLIAALLSANDEQAKAALTSIVEKFDSSKVNIKVLWGIYVSVINNVKSALESEQYLLTDMAHCIRQFALTEFQSYQKLSDAFSETILQFSKVVAAGKADGGSQVIKNIYNEINKHYLSYNVSLNFVAGNIGLSPSYVTKIFKEATGYSVKEYIDLKKMQKAKELLSDTQLSLGDISTQIGFLDTQSFCRKFKAMEGMTPNSYRRKTIQ